MGCSSCEAWLARYVEGDLEPRRLAWMAHHLERCPACERLHRRLRTVDALLATVRPIELADDFATTVMGAVRGLPIPAAAPSRWPLFMIGYLIVGWLALAAASLAFRSRVGVLSAVPHAVERPLAALASMSHSISFITPWAISAVVLVLAIDLLLFAIIALYYRRLAPLALRVSTLEAR